MLGLSKSQIEAAYAAGVNDANLGNFRTNKYSFLESRAKRFYSVFGEVEACYSEDIRHVHHKLEADIRVNQIDEPADQQTFNDVVLWPLVREELEQIAPPEVVIALDLKA